MAQDRFFLCAGLFNHELALKDTCGPWGVGGALLPHSFGALRRVRFVGRAFGYPAFGVNTPPYAAAGRMSVVVKTRCKASPRRQ
jgi:hypothetical protein